MGLCVEPKLFSSYRSRPSIIELKKDINYWAPQAFRDEESKLSAVLHNEIDVAVRMDEVVVNGALHSTLTRQHRT